MTDIYSSTPNSGGYYHVSKSYWANGVVNTLSGIPGVPTITYGVDGEGRWNSVTASSGQNLVTCGAPPCVTYNPAGQVTSVTFTSGDSDAYQYDPAGRMNKYTFNVGGKSVIGQPSWNSNGTLQSLNITDPFNSANQQNCTYGYDALARVSSVGCGSVWAQTFTYDPFGNITKTGNSAWQPTYASPTNNQYKTGWNGVTYDNNGNLTNDTFHTYQWDTNGHASAVDSINVIYDALGRAVEGDWPDGGKAEFVYDETGLTAVMQGTSMGVARIPLPGGAWARYTPSGLSDYWHPDWLGTSRLESTPGRTVDADAAFAPFGEVYAHADNFDLTFTGNTTTDTVIDMYDFPYRRYHPKQGRWITPDPAGLSAADPTNPQSWNRYAYVLNNPLSYKDPTGLWCVWEDGTHDDDPSEGGASSGDCTSQGGHWDSFDTITGIFQQNGNITQINTIYGNCTTSDCGAGTSLQSFDQTLQSYSVLPNNAASTQSSWLGNILNTPWMVSWILPVWPLPPAAGVGPAGSLAWNPKTKTLCGSLGAGASVGDNLAAGPVTGRTLNGQQASPSQINQVFSGWSVNGGLNVPTGPVLVGPGVQGSANGSGAVYGPTVGIAGASVSSTYAVCASF